MPTKHGLHRSKEWLAFTRKVRPQIQRELPAPCVQPKCLEGGVVLPHQSWDVAHRPGMDAYLTHGMPLEREHVGPAHRRCNRSDGGRVGAEKTNRARSRKIRGEFPSW